MSGASWLNWFANPRTHWLKKTMFEILQERYAHNELIVERIGASLLTETDINAFAKLITDVYEAAYLKAVNDHKEQLAKAGLVARIVPDRKS